MEISGVKLRSHNKRKAEKKKAKKHWIFFMRMKQTKTSENKEKVLKNFLMSSKVLHFSSI